MTIPDMVETMGFIFYDCLYWIVQNPLGQCFIAFGFMLCCVRLAFYLFGA